MFVRVAIAIACAAIAISSTAQNPFRISEFSELVVNPPSEPSAGQRAWADACERWDDWDKPGPPFRIHGNTYYVGTCGIASILITTQDGHILIDSGTRKGAEIVAANIASLGFDIRDIEILLMSHEHHDHVGGLAYLAEQSGARVLAIEAAANVLRTGEVSSSDPQHGSIEGFEPVDVEIIDPKDPTVRIGDLGINVIPTPGHTMGATSYQWFACTEDSVCKFLVYADSLSAVSRDGYQFTDHPERIALFRRSFDRIGDLPCGILLTPHPTSSRWHTRFENGTFVHSLTCKIYRNYLHKRLDARLESEAGGNQ